MMEKMRMRGGGGTRWAIEDGRQRRVLNKFTVVKGGVKTGPTQVSAVSKRDCDLQKE